MHIQRTRHLLTLTLLLAASLGASSARAEDLGVSFTAVGVGGLKFVGKTAEISALEQGDKVMVKVLLKNLTTGISLRDKHMTEKYLEVPTYPEAELIVPRSALKFPESGESSGEATGTLTLHGQSKPATFQYKAAKGQQGITVSGTMHLNMKDYGINVPSYLGVTVKPDVDIQAAFAVPAK